VQHTVTLYHLLLNLTMTCQGLIRGPLLPIPLGKTSPVYSVLMRINENRSILSFDDSKSISAKFSLFKAAPLSTSNSARQFIPLHSLVVHEGGAA
jgi:hypothetical protein